MTDPDDKFQFNGPSMDYPLKEEIRVFDASDSMKRLFPLLLTCLLATSTLLDPSPEELLDSIALSEENVLRFYPKVMENMNELNFDRFSKIRAYVAGILPFDEICKGTYKANLCKNKLRKPIEALMKTFTSILDNMSQNETEDAYKNHCAMKNQLKKLASDKVLAVPPFLTPEYPKLQKEKYNNTSLISDLIDTQVAVETSRNDLEESLGRIRNTIELINSMVNSNGLQGFNSQTELSDLLEKLDVFEASLNASS